MNIDDSDLEDLLFYAFRYSLGRSTYVVSDVCDLIKQYKRVVGKKTKYLIIQDIEIAIKNNTAGMKVDIDLWKNLLEELK